MGLSDFSLEGKTAVVVGARRGMGRAFALGFAEAGADVVVREAGPQRGVPLRYVLVIVACYRTLSRERSLNLLHATRDRPR